MAYSERLNKFSKADFLPEGWYWLARARDLRKKTALPIKLWRKDFVVFRGENGRAVVMDAHCPHMGAHLCDGKVEGNEIRCPFHRWRFNAEGHCTDVPVQSEPVRTPKLETYVCEEAYGLIWVWTGRAEDKIPLPVIPELVGLELDSTLGTPFVKNCHPNVVMVNAIDAHHFDSVHNLIVDLDMKPEVLNERCIQFSNVTPMPRSNFLLRFFARFYAKALTYQMTYWWGNTGSVTLGPDFLHFHIMFALRPTAEGKTEGQTILITKARRGVVGWITNRVLLALTKIVGNYFAGGDTVIFSRIAFNFQTPVRADRPILEFIEHYEKQLASWVET